MKPALTTIVVTALMVLGVVSQAQAGIASITASPPSRTVAVNIPAAFTITWRVARNGAPGAVTMESADARIHLESANGPVIHTITKSLSQTKTVVNNIEFFTFSETIIVPRAAIAQAAKAGVGLLLERSFTDDNYGTITFKEVPIGITGASSADFSISRIELQFDDGTTACVTETGKKRTAIARITAMGAGLLRGQWQVREGGGLGSFRTLRTVQATVTAGQKALLQSPALPTVKGGERLDVRLVVESPELAFAEPVITCGTAGKNALMKSPEDAGRIARLLSPRGSVPLSAETKVGWEPVKGAKSYRIEILPNEDGEPITAQMVKPDQRSATFSPLTLDKLESGERYTVRVIAE